MATYQAVVAQTQSSCLIAARERLRAGSKQMATCQAVVQMRPPLKKLLFCARLEAYWHPQTQHLFLSPSSYTGQAFAAGIEAFLFLFRQRALHPCVLLFTAATDGSGISHQIGKVGGMLFVECCIPPL